MAIPFTSSQVDNIPGEDGLKQYICCDFSCHITAMNWSKHSPLTTADWELGVCEFGYGSIHVLTSFLCEFCFLLHRKLGFFHIPVPSYILVLSLLYCSCIHSFSTIAPHTCILAYQLCIVNPCIYF